MISEVVLCEIDVDLLSMSYNCIHVGWCWLCEGLVCAQVTQQVRPAATKVLMLKIVRLQLRMVAAL
jgi:hypothetical protein